MEIEKARPVRHETPGLLLLLPDAVCCRQAALLGCEVCEPCSVVVEISRRTLRGGLPRLFGHCRECAVELVRTLGLSGV